MLIGSFLSWGVSTETEGISRKRLIDERICYKGRIKYLKCFILTLLISSNNETNHWKEQSLSKARSFFNCSPMFGSVSSGSKVTKWLLVLLIIKNISGKSLQINFSVLNSEPCLFAIMCIADGSSWILILMRSKLFNFVSVLEASSADAQFECHSISTL